MGDVINVLKFAGGFDIGVLHLSSLPVRTRACERLKLQRMQAIIVHCIANMLHKNMVQEKHYDLRLFEKQRKIYKSLTYFTSSKVVKETLIPIKSNNKTQACSFV